MPDKLHSEFDALPDVRDSKELHSEFDSLPSSGGSAQPGILEKTGQTLADTARGAGQGLSFGFSDEALGAARAAGDVLSGQNAQDFLKLYRQHQQEEQAANEAAAQRSPIAYNVGDYGSSIASGLLSGGASTAGKLGLKGLLALAGKGAAIGGTQALGRSTATLDQNPGQLATEVGTGAALGGILGPALNFAPKTTGTILGGAIAAPSAIKDIQEGNYLTGGAKALGGLAAGRTLGGILSKPKVAQEASEEIQQSPLKAQVLEAFRAGKAGEGFNKSKDVLSREASKEQSNIGGIKQVFDTAEQKLVGDKQKLLDVADTVLQPEPEKVSQIPQFLEFASKSGEVSRKDLSEIAQVLDLYKQGGLSPKMADAARKKVQQMAYNVQDPNVRGSLSGVADELQAGIEKAVPGYGQANSDIHNFLKSGRETLLSRGKDPEVSQLKVSNLGKEDLKTETELGRIIGSLRNYTPNTTKESQGAVDKTMESLGTLFQDNPDLAKKLGINLPGLEKQIYTAADQNAVANKLIPGALSDLKPSAGMLGIPSMTEKGLIKGANLAGQAVKKSSDLYKLPKEGLVSAAQSLQNSGIPGLTSVGEGLAQSIQSGDQHKTNATLFTILQNPSARKFLGYSPENESKVTGDSFGQ